MSKIKFIPQGEYEERPAFKIDDIAEEALDVTLNNAPDSKVAQASSINSKSKRTFKTYTTKNKARFVQDHGPEPQPENDYVDKSTPAGKVMHAIDII